MTKDTGPMATAMGQAADAGLEALRHAVKADATSIPRTGDEVGLIAATLARSTNPASNSQITGTLRDAATIADGLAGGEISRLTDNQKDTLARARGYAFDAEGHAKWEGTIRDNPALTEFADALLKLTNDVTELTGQRINVPKLPSGGLGVARR